MATGGRDDYRNPNGTVVPNNIFVGGISGNTDEDDLWNFFSKFGNVKATKIILDKAGMSKGYGFVTFETEEEAENVINNSECQILKDRKLNIGTAVKKQPYGRSSETSSAHTAVAPVVWPTQQYSGTPAGYSRDSMFYPQASWPLMWPQQFYLQQQQYPPTAQSGYPQYVYSIAPPDYPYQTATAVNSDYSETSSVDRDDDRESVTSRSKQPATTPATDYERARQVQSKASTSSQRSSSRSSSVTRFSNGSAETPPSYVHSAPVHHMHHPVFAKTVNGVTVMAYPRSFVMGSPVIHMKDCGATDSDNVFSELGYLHSPMTPPATPLAAPMPCDFNSNVESIR